MASNACSAEVGRSQKMRSARNLQVRQLSIMSSPYGESTKPPPVTRSQPVESASCAPAPMHTGGDYVTIVTLSVSIRPEHPAVTGATIDCDRPHRPESGPL